MDRVSTLGSIDYLYQVVKESASRVRHNVLKRAGHRMKADDRKTASTSNTMNSIAMM